MNSDLQPSVPPPASSLPVTAGIAGGYAAQFPSAPYRGIEYFRFVDHPIFFGRQSESLELLRSVVIYKGVLLFGSSGTGKSSLINAGLLPRIIEMGFAPDRIRVQNRANEEFVIERISLNDDGRAPFLSPTLADASDGRGLTVFSVDQFKEHLRSVAKEHRPFLIFDQFEEVITLFEETPHTPDSLREALARQKQIMDTIVGFLHDDSMRIKILFAFREDYLAKLGKLCLMAPELPNQAQRLHLPQAGALNDIIAGPLKEELLSHYKSKQTFPRVLIDRLIEGFTQRSEHGAINLSEVQIVCVELWKSEDPSALFEQREIQGLLEDYLTSELAELPAERRALATGLLSYMLTSGNTRNFISGVELIRAFQNEEPAVTKEALEDALRALTGTRLVRRELRRSEYFYEIASEFLVPWIIEQKIARQSNLERRRIEAETEREREEERKRANQRLKYTRWFMLLVTVIMILAVVLAVHMTRGKRRETKYKDDALKAQKTAVDEGIEKQAIIDVLKRIFQSPPATPRLDEREMKSIQSKLATNKIEGLGYISSRINENSFPLEEAPKLVGAALLEDSDPNVAKAAQDVLKQANDARGRQAELQKQAEQNKVAAINQMKEMMREGKFPKELVLALLSPTLTAADKNSPIAQATSELLNEAAAREGTDLGNSIAQAVITNPEIANLVPARVYIQIETKNQWDKANAIKIELEKQGYIVPKFEIVDFRAPRANEIRYYNKDDEKNLQRLVDSLKALQLEVKTVHLAGYEKSAKLGPDHYELWLAAESTPGDNWYLVISYSPGTRERREALVQQITPVIEGAKIEAATRREIKVGPYTEDQARTVRQRLSDLDPELKRRTIPIKR